MHRAPAPVAALALCLAFCASAPTRAQADDAPAAEPDVAKGESDEDKSDEGKSDEGMSDEDKSDEAAENADDEEEPVSVDRFRNPVEVLNEHFLGSASRPVRFDWRRANVGFGFLGSELIERNTFGSFRAGGLVRRAFGDVMVEGAATWVFVFPTESSQLLALTPYEQAGRPSRLELDINAGYPLFEAVVTPLFSWIPPAEVVLYGMAGFRYLFYWQGYQAYTTDDLLELGTAVVSPFLSEEERIEIERYAPGGMLVDYARYHVLGGLALDLYFQPGVLISPRANLALPLLSGVTSTRLGLWWEMSIVLGYAL